MESSSPGVPTDLISRASMGPRPEGHGEPSNDPRDVDYGGYSNDASMGPRPEGHGELIFLARWNANPLTLQWGHVQKDMERCSTDLMVGSLLGLQWGHVQKDMERNVKTPQKCDGCNASMGPRPEGHGEPHIAMGSDPGECYASMGPRPEGHGEIRIRGRRMNEVIELQWGHVQKDMERVLNPSSPLVVLLASMGPRPEGHGELAWACFRGVRQPCFNGATSRRTWRVS